MYSRSPPRTREEKDARTVERVNRVLGWDLPVPATEPKERSSSEEPLLGKQEGSSDEESEVEGGASVSEENPFSDSKEIDESDSASEGNPFSDSNEVEDQSSAEDENSSEDSGEGEASVDSRRHGRPTQRRARGGERGGGGPFRQSGEAEGLDEEDSRLNDKA